LRLDQELILGNQTSYSISDQELKLLKFRLKARPGTQTQTHTRKSD